MEWYDIHRFVERLDQIEEFFIEIAAKQEQLLIFGFKRALELPSAKAGIEGLKTFSKDFTLLKRFMLRMDRDLAQQITSFDPDGTLVEEISQVNLHLRMAEARDVTNRTLAAVTQVMLAIPFASKLVKNNEFFAGSTRPLSGIIAKIDRLKALASICADFITHEASATDDVFKPMNVQPDIVVDLIDKALLEIQQIVHIPPTAREQILEYLNEAKREALSPK